MSAAPGRSALRGFLAIDERESLVELVQTARGRLLLFPVAVCAVSTYN